MREIYLDEAKQLGKKSFRLQQKKKLMRNKLIYPNDYPYKTLLLINIHIQNQKKKSLIKEETTSMSCRTRDILKVIFLHNVWRLENF